MRRARQEGKRAYIRFCDGKLVINGKIIQGSCVTNQTNKLQAICFKIVNKKNVYISRIDSIVIRIDSIVIKIDSIVSKIDSVKKTDSMQNYRLDCVLFGSILQQWSQSFSNRYLPTLSIPTLSIPTLSIPIWSMLTKWELTKWVLTKWEVDEVGS